MTVEVAECQARFEELISRVEAGEEILISRDGTPVARLVPVGKRVLGRENGVVQIPDDFDEPLF